jgi:hypothetical protein
LQKLERNDNITASFVELHITETNEYWVLCLQNQTGSLQPNPLLFTKETDYLIWTVLEVKFLGFCRNDVPSGWPRFLCFNYEQQYIF